METIDYQKVEFPYHRPAELGQAERSRRPVIVVGAGPIGLSLALDLAQQQVPVLLFDDDYRLSTGSRAICFSKRTLDIWDRLGVGQRMMDKGVSWNVGKVFFRHEEIWQFNLLPEPGHRRPAFINLQQYYAEGYLQEAAAQNPLIELRWKHKVVALQHLDQGVMLTVETPDGQFEIEADYVIACDGSRSPLRRMLGQESHGRTFRDRFLIADIKMEADFPPERWFWFDPPFHPNQSVLLHRQPDQVWRVDFQLGWDADPEEEVKPERVIPRLQALFGADARFTLEWVSIYTFSCLRMDSFRHGRVLFAGDSAHGVSPFGARGANSGVQDTDNLAWKLALVLRDLAPDALLDSYAREREYAADENILNSSRATDFITPKSEISRLFRNTVLKLAKRHDFARSLVNSGRLSVPATLHDSELNTDDQDSFQGLMVPGAAAVDAPVSGAEGDWLLGYFKGAFTVLHFLDQDQPLPTLPDWPAGIPMRVVGVLPAGSSPRQDCIVDTQGLVRQRYDGQAGTTYLLRPDQHVAGRWRKLCATTISTALDRALARTLEHSA